ncbi:MAG: hypothetical protein Ct9H90mP24_4640 [Methanobacteriota archaeon]|nr:MAG: hypothetical protein Ct9H90mP24_4640 [Euryarchaeota archaeon]
MDGVCNYLDLDDDGDGLSDLNETSVHLTDPLDSDSDDDGLDDYQEVVIYGPKGQLTTTPMMMGSAIIKR